MTTSVQQQENGDLISLAADIVSAYVSNNPVPVAELPNLIGDTHAALQRIGTPDAETATPQEPAVSIKRSVTPDHIVCLEDGKKFKSLRRHLNVHYNLTPDEYRQKWKLPSDYPMVAPNYAAARSALAKAAGLGRKPSGPLDEPKKKSGGRTAAAATKSSVAKSPAKKPRVPA
ncbi:MAG: MucR family transcriptional regulator [Mesorhizobium sp.]|uniref:MucR family transcriptional regulator n=1 Tax=unclassified Mesorhizobium TaxID=325217 RepID=UPI000F75FF5E|nr:MULTISPECIES: MucR family transcriptional regulator [unclassified Mesorhizobium]RVC71885.1 MucR family transcriptional regulator [Mesorhizobium sp. M2A.F.Ca.ET.046.02.1.1]AZO34036.1 MucR family transcriptional regulator [Mesorhizobium sp. M2A.F.Ca.ET.046.03.2.1]AZO71459.1 MucR family transcriptional regulator [Mesorhizobium sp. M1D.F.Ca.ET.043.01.1.1]RWB47008.1 MAG: MucR family transcriptional regulator [Mesorhizobium sp.]RWE20794.1 MAG: MucR family transcriptional regulator [Mesorhizobium 